MDVAKLPPAALTAENTEMEGGKGKQRVEIPKRKEKDAGTQDEVESVGVMNQRAGD